MEDRNLGEGAEDRASQPRCIPSVISCFSRLHGITIPMPSYVYIGSLLLLQMARLYSDEDVLVLHRVSFTITDGEPRYIGDT